MALSGEAISHGITSMPRLCRNWPVLESGTAGVGVVRGVSDSLVVMLKGGTSKPESLETTCPTE